MSSILLDKASSDGTRAVAFCAIILLAGKEEVAGSKGKDSADNAHDDDVSDFNFISLNWNRRGHGHGGGSGRDFGDVSSHIGRECLLDNVGVSNYLGRLSTVDRVHGIGICNRVNTIQDRKSSHFLRILVRKANPEFLPVEIISGVSRVSVGGNLIVLDSHSW